MSTHRPVAPTTPDHYFNLGLAVSATEIDIKIAFRKLALLHHPDKKAPGADATKFVQIREAHDALTSPSSRLAYDAIYPQLRIQWINYRRGSVDYEQRRREERIRRASERAREEAESARRRERAEKERLAEERSREAIQRAQRERERAAIEVLRQLDEVQERDRRAKEQKERTIREQREREAEARSARVLQQARDEQRQRALAAKRVSDAAQTARLERVKVANHWAQEKHARHAASSSRGEYVQLGWTEEQGVAACDFCNETVRLYHFRCPLGDAVACGNCLNSMSAAVQR